PPGGWRGRPAGPGTSPRRRSAQPSPPPSPVRGHSREPDMSEPLIKRGYPPNMTFKPSVGGSGSYGPLPCCFASDLSKAGVDRSTNAKLTLYLNLCLVPQGSKGPYDYRSSDKRVLTLLDWPAGVFDPWREKVCSVAQGFWNKKFWLVNATDYSGLDVR